MEMILSQFNSLIILKIYFSVILQKSSRFLSECFEKYLLISFVV
jgi:hypothetical protein